MRDLKDCSREDLIRIIAKMQSGIGEFFNSNTGYDNETCELLNSIGLQAIEECDTIGWKSEEKPKLEWQENPPEKLMTWDEATQYADSLNTMSEYGWRLPTKEELKNAYVNDLEGFDSTDYWSSSTYAQDTTNAWYVDFDDGGVYDYSKASDSYVRCVREVK